MGVSTAPSRRPAPPPPPARTPAGLTVVPGSQGHRPGVQQPARRNQSKFGAKFRSNPVRVSCALLLVSAVVFGLVLLNIHVAQTSFHLSDLQRQADQLETQQRRLRLELARAESPEKIAEMGASLGLVAPAAQERLQGPSVLVGSVEDRTEGDTSSR